MGTFIPVSGMGSYDISRLPLPESGHGHAHAITVSNAYLEVAPYVLNQQGIRDLRFSS